MVKQLDLSELEADYYRSLSSQAKTASIPDFSANTINLQASDPNLIKWQLEINVFLKRQYLFLKGFVKDPLTKKWEQTSKPRASEEGISHILQFLSNELYKTITLSNLSENDVLNMASDARFTLTELFYLKHDDWIMEMEDCTQILIESDHTIRANLRRAFLEGERKYHKAVQRFTEQIVHQRPPKKSNIGEVWQ